MARPWPNSLLGACTKTTKPRATDDTTRTKQREDPECLEMLRRRVLSCWRVRAGFSSLDIPFHASPSSVHGHGHRTSCERDAGSASFFSKGRKSPGRECAKMKKRRGRIKRATGMANRNDPQGRCSSSLSRRFAAVPRCL
mgnify:CR=1 FL=1